MKLKNLAVAGTAAVAALTGSVLLSSPASAASYNGACGSGYSVINSASVGSAGTVFLTYNSSTGYNCAATIRNTRGSAIYMGVAIWRQGTDEDFAKRDYGNYTHTAGPVYTYGKGSCMNWSGTINATTVTRKNTNCG